MKAFLLHSLLPIILVTLVLNFISATNVTAQIPSAGGSYTIDTTLANSFTGGVSGNFKSFKRAIAALNATSAGSINSNVTFTVTSGQTFGETPLINITYTNVNPFNPKITFVKSSVADPVLLGTTGVGTTDAVIRITGGNNYVFNGIDLKDNSANTNGTLAMEYGLYLLNGCNNNIYENGTITLNQGFTNTVVNYGILVQNSLATLAGENNNNTFYNNTISTVFAGYYFQGATSFPDAGNKVTTIGGGTSVVNNNKMIGSVTFGVLFQFQSTFEVSNTNINNTANVALAAGSVYGIANATNTAGAGGLTGSVINIYGNTVRDFTVTINAYGILTSTGTTTGSTVNIHDNTIANLKSSSIVGGSANGINNVGTGNPGGLFTIYNNNVSTIQNTGTSCSVTTNTAGIYSSTVTTSKIFANIINGVSSSISTNSGSSVTANTYGIYHNGAAGNSIDTMYNNIISNITVSATSATGSVYGLYTGGNGHSTIYGNKVSTVTANSFTSTTAPFPVAGIQIGAGGPAGCDVFSNSISTIQSKTTLVAGIQQSASGPITPSNKYNYYQNNINGVTGTGTLTSTYGINFSNGTGSNLWVYLDTVLNVTSTSVSNSGQVAGINVLPNSNNRVYMDTISTVSSASTTTAVTNGVCGIFMNSIAIDSVFNCKINNITSATTSANTAVNGVYSTGTGTKVIFGNLVNNILNTGAGGAGIGQYTGIYVISAITSNIFKNLIHTVYTSSTGTGAAIGIHAQTGGANIYNNMIYDIRADKTTNATVAPETRGISAVDLTTFANVYYNTVFLNGVATSVSNNSAALYTVNNAANILTFRNNIFDNEYNVTSNTAANAVASAIFAANGAKTSFNAATNNNVLYNGKNQGYFNVNRNLLYFDVSTGDSAANQTRYRSLFTAPAVEQQSIADQPVNYVNTTTLPYDLHLNTGSCSSLSGSPALFNAVTIAGYTNDFDGNLRGTGAILGSSPSPTVGADEPGGPYRTSNNNVANTIKGPTTVCQGVSATYTIPPIASPNPATSYAWRFMPAGTTGSGSNSQSNTFASSGISQVQAWETGPCSLLSDTAKLSVNVLSSTVGTPAAPSGVTTRCQGSGTNVYIVTNNQQGYTYNWTITAGASTILGSVPGCTNCSLTATGTGPMATVNWDPNYSGSATITVAANNGCGTSSTSSLNVTVNPSVVAAGAISGPASVCLGQNGVVYSVPSITNATSYNWVIPPTGVSIVGAATNNSITLNFSGSAASGNLTVNGLDACGSGTNNTLAITVHSLPTVTASVSTPVTGAICLLDSATLAAGGASTYIWSPTGGLAQNTGAAVNTSPASTTTYTVIGTDVNNCSNSATTVLTVNPLPPLSVSPQSAVCTGGVSATLTASGANTYSWAPNVDINTTTGAVVTAQISNLTFYTVTGTGADLCTANVVVPVATVATGGTISPTSTIICSGGTQLLTVSGAAGHDYQWQISTDDVTWTNIAGATNTSYTTNTLDGGTLKYYRLQANSNTCWNVASTTAIVDISNPTIIATATAVTDQTITLNWTPVGSGNYTVSWSGASAGSSSNATPPKTITGLTPGGTYSITVTQTGIVGCPASGTVASVTTLCGAPTGLTATTPSNHQMNVSWTGTASSYRVFYRPLFTANSYFTQDVTGVTSATITKEGSNILPASTTFEVYVTSLNCPTSGITGQPTAKIYVTTPPALSCPAPVIDNVQSTCPIQIEVFMHTAGNYQIYFQRLTPTVQGVVSYPVTGNYFTVNIGSAGQTYLIAAASNCGGGSYSNLVIWPGNLTVKPLCSTINNLVLSNPTCHGFTASWNIDQCLSNNVSYYQIYLRQQGNVNWNSYPVQPVPPAPIGPYKLVNWLAKGTVYQVYVRSIYSCNGYNTAGPASNTLTETTLSAGCKDDDQEATPLQPSVQQYSQDKSEVMSIYPNPNNGEFMLDISRLSNSEDKVRVEVINMLGQTVMTDLTNISGGNMSEFIRLPNTTASGNYFVRVTVGNNVYTTKINISR